MAAPRYWLVKSEPSVYSWETFVREGSARWDGVRNHEARNNLRAMKLGDLALFYHSNEGKEIVGVARVTRVAYQDPTTDGDWSAVDLAPVAPFAKPVPLAKVRTLRALAKMALLTRSRLSVSPVTAAEFRALLKAGETTLGP